MVWFHVMDYKIVYFAVANDLAYILLELHEQVYFYSISQYDFLNVYKIRVVTDTIR